LPEQIRDSSVVGEIRELFTQLERAGVKNAMFDITLMRGLDYYTGTVFEVYDTHPENSRALFGGGRYDGLVGLFGGEPVSAVGFAPGLTMTELFLHTHKLVPKLASTTDIYMVVIGDNQRAAGNLARDLRREGVNVELDFTGRKLDKQLKTAVKKAIPYILFVGEAELNTEVYPLKNTATGDEKRLSFERIVSTITDRRSKHRADDDDFDLL
jgi:histidyl-tRNA synthetase